MRKWDCESYSDCLTAAAQTQTYFYNDENHPANDFCRRCKKYVRKKEDIFVSDSPRSYVQLIDMIFHGRIRKHDSF
jgi:hypothetical protein